MIVGNPKGPRIMGEAHLAYQRHGLSIQGLLPDYRASCERSDIVREVFWAKALTNWCRVDYLTALHTVADLGRATRTQREWLMKEEIERLVRGHIREAAG